MTISASQIKDLRDATGVGFLDCRKALEESNGDFEKAVDLLRERGLAKAAKRAGREASEGVLELYDHGNGRVGVMVEVNCETDFVARSEAFRTFAHEIALQIAAASPQWVKEEDIPEDVLEREGEIARNMALEEGKPEHILDRIVEGRLKKFKEEFTLMQQPYIRDEDLTIEKFLHETVASLGENIVIRRFVRWEVGEKSAS
jgi:elongation factor Ts